MVPFHKKETIFLFAMHVRKLRGYLNANFKMGPFLCGRKPFSICHVLHKKLMDKLTQIPKWFLSTRKKPFSYLPCISQNTWVLKCKFQNGSFPLLKETIFLFAMNPKKKMDKQGKFQNGSFPQERNHFPICHVFPQNYVDT